MILNQKRHPLRLVAVLASVAMLLSACQPAAPALPPTVAPAAAPTQAVAKPAPTSAASSATGSAAVSPAPSAAASPAASAPSPAASAPPTTAPVAFAGTPVSLRASYSNAIADNLPEWMALEGGYFTQNGLDVQLDNIASSTGIPALLSGQVQVAQLGGSETLSAAAGGGDLVILGVIGPVYPFVFMAPPSITGVDQLKGKKIGVSNVGSTSDIATRVMLRRIGLDPDKDVTIVAVGSLENRVAALLNGAIDGGLAQPPDQLVLEDKGFHVIYDLAAQHLPAISTVVVVQRAWLDANHDVAQRYVDALCQGVARARSDRETTLKVLQKYLKNDDPRALGVTYDFFVGQVTPQYPTIKPEQFSESISQLSQTNDKIKSFDYTKMLDNAFVQSAQDRKVGQ